MAKSEAELMQQFEETITDMLDLANGLLKPTNPENLEYIKQRFHRLKIIVRQNPEQAEAVLYCADAMWHLLYDTAHTGVGVQHRRDGLPDSAPMDDVMREWFDLHEQEPDIGKTEAVRTITKNLKCSERTVWNRLKEAGI